MPFNDDYTAAELFVRSRPELKASTISGFELIQLALQKIAAENAGGGVGGGASGAVTIAEGDDVALGRTTDALAVAGSTGTVQAKLRRLTADMDTLLSRLLTLNGHVDMIETLITAQYPTETYRPAPGSVAAAVIKPSSGRLFSLTCTNMSQANKRWLHLFDSAVAPSGIGAEVYPIYPSDGMIILGTDVLGSNGQLFSTGIAFGVSENAMSYVAVSATEVIIKARYI